MRRPPHMLKREVQTALRQSPSISSQTSAGLKPGTAPVLGPDNPSGGTNKLPTQEHYSGHQGRLRGVEGCTMSAQLGVLERNLAG